MKDRSDDPLHHEWTLYQEATSCSGSTMKDQSDDPLHHEWTLYQEATSHSGSTMKDRSDDPLHHEWTLYQEAISHSGSTMKDRSNDPLHTSHSQTLPRGKLTSKTGVLNWGHYYEDLHETIKCQCFRYSSSSSLCIQFLCSALLNGTWSSTSESESSRSCDNIVAGNVPKRKTIFF